MSEAKRILDVWEVGLKAERDRLCARLAGIDSQLQEVAFFRRGLAEGEIHAVLFPTGSLGGVQPEREL